jgi:hypothetical protein
MALQHKDITEANLHEPKGVSTAAANKVYLSNGTGSGTWTNVPIGSVDGAVGNAGAFVVVNGSGGIEVDEKLFRYSVNFGVLLAVAANTSAEQSITVTGITPGDDVLRVIKPTHQAGLAIGNVRVTALNTIAVQFINNTAAPITPTASETYTVYAWRP